MRKGLLTLAALVLLAVPSFAADGDINLSERQSGVAQRYQRLEELLLRLAEVEGGENPERSALLRRAAKQSRDKFVLEQLRAAADSLKTQEFQRAVESQEGAEKELAALLTLLLSEDRSKRIRDEKERYANLIKDLKRNLNNQRSTRARTENQADLDDVLDEQKDVTERSEELKQRLSDENQTDQQGSQSQSQSDSESQNESQQSSSDQEKSESQEADSKDKDSDDQSKPNERESENEKDPSQKEQDPSSKQPSGEQKPSDQDSSQQSESQQSESQQSQSQQSQSQQQQQQSQQQQSQQQQSQQQQSQQQSQQQQSQQQQSQQQQQQQPSTPEQEVEQQLKEAIEKMKQAEKELEDAKRDEATERQREAEEKLREAIDRLEQILRQLREEEMLRELAKLEARLRKMAAMQTKVLEDTVALAATPKSQRNRQTDLKAGDLAFEEKKITLEADRAMLLLREEGSSVAFPEVVSQIRSDTVRVTEMLGQTKIDAVCQGLQQDILAALQEMIDAVQKAQRDLEQQQQQQQSPPQQSRPGEQPLVEALAELKLIRTMEKRIKSTTDRYAGLLETGDSVPADIRPLLQDLSDRQNRLYRITRDLVSKRNQ